MGCFSYICKKCGKPVNSTSFDGEWTHIFYIRDGVPIEHMYGEYDSYGRVFKGENNPGSYDWDVDWSKAVGIHFNKSKKDGFAVIHGACFKGILDTPHTISDDDPDQGWGKLKKRFTKDKGIKPFHEIINEKKREPVWFNDEV